MTPAEERLRATFRAYADRQQPPPLDQVIDRPAPLRRPRVSRFALAAGVVLLAGAGTAGVLVHRAGTVGPAVPLPLIVSSAPAPARMAPACPPFARLTGTPFTVEARPGERLHATGRVVGDGLLTYGVYLLPAGAHMTGVPDDLQLDQALAHTVLRLRPGQRSFTLALTVPSAIPPGRYEVAEYSTFAGPAICGRRNPSPAPMTGGQGGPIGRLTVRS